MPATPRESFLDDVLYLRLVDAVLKNLVLGSDSERYEVTVLAATATDELTVVTDPTDYFVWRMANAVTWNCFNSASHSLCESHRR